MWIIAGLGNPERKYDNTRHNAGFAAIDALLREQGDLKLNDTKFEGAYTKCIIEGESVLLVKPLTYMNESGRCLAPLANFYKIPPEQIIVISDDITLPVGQLRVRPKGSAGGHNGLKSIIACLGTENFPRVRVGVGAKPDYMDLAAHVLGKFNQTDERVMAESYMEAGEACIDILTQGCAAAMNRHNMKRDN